jgi:hypothetical protein
VRSKGVAGNGNAARIWKGDAGENHEASPGRDAFFLGELGFIIFRRFS